MASIYLNDEIYQIEPAQSLHDLLMQNNHIGQHFAVAINNQFIPRTAYSTTTLYPGDRIDIIVPMQGG
ncbi:sulfur carrier protein ThiS [Legionella brunensis]|uniref:Thiamine biosynthesis sulfur transport protein ThiS n=1 Tax=Legionella brunensis TaxID=29422 RepID=A0A0W0S4E6_9GAMM|nr:sulfur carrier protein ThiS [Legionella brunensis]KTC78358.1 Thiamine biosynthesis sulfur transport protein ThiS [Legionella brunensis]